MTVLYYQVRIVTESTSEATASPRRPFGSFLHRAVVQSHSPVKASPPRPGAPQRTLSPFTRSGRARQTRTENKDLFDMSTQVTYAYALNRYLVNKIHFQTNTESVQCFSIKYHNESFLISSGWTMVGEFWRPDYLKWRHLAKDVKCLSIYFIWRFDGNFLPVYV